MADSGMDYKINFDEYIDGEGEYLARLTNKWPQLLAVALFYALNLLVGIWASSKKKGGSDENEKNGKLPASESSSNTSTEKQPLKNDVDEQTDDIMLAGRSIGLLVGCFTMTATWCCGAYILGTAEKAFDTGLLWIQGPLGYSLSLFLGGAFFASKMRNEGYITMLDPMQLKYGERFGGLCVIPPVCGEVFWTASILVALGSTVSVILEVNQTISIVVSAIIAIIYTLFGGLYAVAYTDVAQLIAMMTGLIMAVPFVMKQNNISLNGLFSTSDHNVPQCTFPPTNECAKEQSYPTSINKFTFDQNFNSSFSGTMENLYTPEKDYAALGMNNAETMWDDAKIQFYDWIGKISAEKAGGFWDKYLLCILGGIPWQVYFQRVLSCDTAKNAKILSFVGGFGCLIAVLPPLAMGYMARMVDWSGSETYVAFILRKLVEQSATSDGVSLDGAEYNRILGGGDYNHTYTWATISPAKPTGEDVTVACNLYNVMNIVNDASNPYRKVLPKICGQSQKILPLLLEHLTHPVIGAIGIGTISAAVMSSADSSILSSSSMLSRNFYKMTIRPNAKDKEMLIVLKLSICILGAVSTYLACTIQSVYYLWILASDLVYTVLFPHLTLTVHFSKYCNGWGAWAGYGTAFVLRALSGALTHAYQPGVFSWFQESPAKAYQFPFRTAIMLINTVVTVIVSQIAVYIFKNGILDSKHDYLGSECLNIEEGQRNSQGNSEQFKKLEVRRKLLKLSPVKRSVDPYLSTNGV